LRSDVSLSFRQLLREPRTHVAIVVTLALGVGSTTTVYAVFNHLALRPTPGIAAPEQLVSVMFQPAGEPLSMGGGSAAAVSLYRDAIDELGLESLAIWSGTPKQAPAVLREHSEPRLAEVEYVQLGYLEALGVRPRHGRLFTPAELADAAPRVTLVSEALWRRELGGRADALGRSINVNGVPFEIVGVLDDYRGWGQTAANTVDVWLPMAAASPGAPPDTTVFLLVGRRRPGETAAAIQQRLRALYEPVRATLRGPPAAFVPWVHDGLRSTPRAPRRLPSLPLVLGASLLLLLLACANAASLLMASHERRRHDLAVRAALGASRWQLSRSLMLDAMVLGAAAVAGGLLLTAGVVRLLDGARLLSSVRPLSDVTVDWRVAVFSAAMGLATVFVFALLPVMAASRVDLRTSLQESARTTTVRNRFRRGLVAAQVGLALVLLAGAGVLARSLWNLGAIPLGMQPNGVYAFTFDPRLAGARGAAGEQLLQRVIEDLRATRGVEAVATANPSVFNASLNLTTELRLAHEAPQPSASVKGPTIVSPEYFDALGVPVLAGRSFTAAEARLGSEVPGQPAILSASAARLLFGRQSPIGQHVAVGASFGEWKRRRLVRIVGVAGDTRTAWSLREDAPPPMLYEAAGQMLVSTRVYVKSSLATENLASRVRQALWTANPRLLAVDAGTLATEVERLYPEERTFTWLLASIALVATALGFAGVYAVTARQVAARTREIGVRMALGASPAAVMRLAGASLVPATVAGIAGGLAVYAATAQAIASRLFGVTPLDASTLVIVSALLAAVVAVAAWLPARRAARVDPVSALRD
jgi:predicted permease